MVDLWKPSLSAIYEALNGQVRLVGGCVRDCLMGRKPKDIDLATPLMPKAVLADLRASRITSHPIAPAYGVVVAVIDGERFEITTLRRDDYTPRGKERITFIADYETDAARRDFTINAMSVTRDGTVWDYFDGRADLNHRIVRFIGDPPRRLWEDPLRALRYARFWAMFGGEKPDETIVSLCREARTRLPLVSKTRRQKELNSILTMGTATKRAIDLLNRMDIIPFAVQGLADNILLLHQHIQEDLG